jgi:hypothetical protein
LARETLLKAILLNFFSVLPFALTKPSLFAGLNFPDVPKDRYGDEEPLPLGWKKYRSLAPVKK